MKSNLYRIAVLGLKVCCALCMLLVITIAILFLWLSIPYVELVDKTTSPDNKWVAITKYQDSKIAPMLAPPFYSVYLRPNVQWFKYFKERKIAEVEYTDNRPPQVKWQNEHHLIINKADHKAALYTKALKYKNISISYDTNSGQ